MSITRYSPWLLTFSKTEIKRTWWCSGWGFCWLFWTKICGKGNLLKSSFIWKNEADYNEKGESNFACVCLNLLNFLTTLVFLMRVLPFWYLCSILQINTTQATVESFCNEQVPGNVYLNYILSYLKSLITKKESCFPCYPLSKVHWKRLLRCWQMSFTSYISQTFFESHIYKSTCILWCIYGESKDNVEEAVRIVDLVALYLNWMVAYSDIRLNW